MIRNFSDDIRDSEIYSELLAQVAPKDSHISKDYMSKEDWLERAEMMLSTADSINCRAFVTAKVKFWTLDLHDLKLMLSPGCCEWSREIEPCLHRESFQQPSRTGSAI